MDSLPDALVRDLVKVDHDTVQLRIGSVFSPFPTPLLWVCTVLASPTLALPLLSLLMDGPEGLPLAVFGPLPFLVLLCFSLWQTSYQQPTLWLSLGMSHLKIRSGGGPVRTLPLADLEEAWMRGDHLAFVLRSGEGLIIGLPERSKQTTDALDALLVQALERGREGMGEVPAEMEALLYQGTQRAAQANLVSR